MLAKPLPKNVKRFTFGWRTSLTVVFAGESSTVQNLAITSKEHFSKNIGTGVTQSKLLLDCSNSSDSVEQRLKKNSYRPVFLLTSSTRPGIGLPLISSHTLFASVVKRSPFDLKSELHSCLSQESIRKADKRKCFIQYYLSTKKRVFEERKVNSSQISGLSLRGGGYYKVAPGHFHRKIEEK